MAWFYGTLALLNGLFAIGSAYGYSEIHTTGLLAAMIGNAVFFCLNLLGFLAFLPRAQTDV